MYQIPQTGNQYFDKDYEQSISYQIRVMQTNQYLSSFCEMSKNMDRSRNLLSYEKSIEQKFCVNILILLLQDLSLFLRVFEQNYLGMVCQSHNHLQNAQNDLRQIFLKMSIIQVLTCDKGQTQIINLFQAIFHRQLKQFISTLLDYNKSYQIRQQLCRYFQILIIQKPPR
ncbi:hypothetical protein pb186bvf_020513 [Paramecium bursaria]